MTSPFDAVTFTMSVTMMIALLAREIVIVAVMTGLSLTECVLLS